MIIVEFRSLFLGKWCRKYARICREYREYLGVATKLWLHSSSKYSIKSPKYSLISTNITYSSLLSLIYTFNSETKDQKVETTKLETQKPHKPSSQTIDSWKVFFLKYDKCQRLTKFKAFKKSYLRVPSSN